MTKDRGLLALALCAVLAGSAAADTLQLVTEKTLSGALVGVTADGRLRFKTAEKEEILGGDDVYALEAGAKEAVSVPAGAHCVHLSDGSRFFVVNTAMAAGGRFSAESKLFGKVEFLLPVVAGVRFQGEGKPPPAFEQRLAKALADKRTRDTLLALTKDAIVELEGELKSIDAAKLTFRYDDQDRAVNLPRVYAVAPAAVAGPRNTAVGPEATAELTDGSRLRGRLIKAGEDSFTLMPTGFLAEVVLPRKAVTRLAFAADRLVELSSLEEIARVERHFVQLVGAADSNPAFPLKRNKSVGGGPLRLDGVEYSTGIGCHSYTRLVYALNGEYESFSAQIGIDDAERPGGHVEFVVLLDGKEAFRKGMSGKDKSVPLRVDVGTAREMTLIVDFGEMLHFHDHADWAGARLLRKKR
jgi:hypothetical protein